MNIKQKFSDVGICKECGIETSSIRSHIKHKHNMLMLDYRLKHEPGFVPIICDICQHKEATEQSLAAHKKEVHNILSDTELKRNRLKESATTKCEVCGEMFCGNRGLSRHLKKDHQMETIDYYRKYRMRDGETGLCKQCGVITSFRFDTGFSDFCGFSCSTSWLAKNTDRTAKAWKTIKEKQKEDPNFCLNPSQLQYWINKGYSEEDARKKQSERQTTFSLEKMVEEYGEEKGTLIWKERQLKWQDTLNSKDPKEIERINREKMNNGRGYSKISQVIFDEITKRLAQYYPDFINEKIYYATRKNDDITPNKNNDHYEYMLYDQINLKHYFLDYYIPRLNLIVEFDGDYWHGEARGNQQRNEEREENIKNILPKVKIIHIKEGEYLKNKDFIINEIVDEIKNLLK